MAIRSISPRPDAHGIEPAVVVAGERVTYTGSLGNRLVGDVCGPVGAAHVVLLHGGGQTRHAWNETRVELGRRGWRALAIDQRGHGDSDWVDPDEYGVAGFAEDVAAVSDALGAPAAFVGASLGGLAALQAIGESNEQAAIARCLVLVDVAHRLEAAGSERITTFMAGHPEGFASVAEAVDAVAAYNPHRQRPRDDSGLRKNLRRRDDGRWVWHWDPRFLAGRTGDVGAQTEAALDPERLREAAARLTIPVLLVRGRVSDLLSPEVAEEFLDLVPHAGLVDVAGAGHMIAGDRNSTFNAAVLPFLERMLGRRG